MSKRGIRLVSSLALILIGSAGLVHAAGPAVSAPNGKLEFDAGILGGLSSTDGFFRGAGSLAIPLTNDFGLQGDVMLATGGAVTASAAFHAFTRDPQSHLLGGAIGFAHAPGSTVIAAGPEAELYQDHWSFEGWAGIAKTSGGLGGFLIGEIAYYPDDNWRLSGGFSLLGGAAAVQFSSEYLITDWSMPTSLTLDTKLSSDGSVTATAGLKVYFSDDNHKSLIRRHREDDPQNRGTDLLGASSPRAGGAPIDPNEVYTGKTCDPREYKEDPVTDTCVPS